MDASNIDGRDIEATASGEALLQHADWLRRLARSLVQDAAERDDLVQETWLAALRARAADGRPLKPWLSTVARNFSKRSFRTRERPTANPAQGKIDPGLPDPSDVAEKLEAERRLTEALSSLDEPFRSTLFLRFYEDLSSPEIAARTNSPAGTVRWRLKRGLELLREHLDEESAPGTWLALLLPLATTGSPASVAILAAGAGTAASPIAAIFGALAMNTMIKALVAALVLALVYVGLDATSVLPESLSMRASTTSESAIVVPETMARVEPGTAAEAAQELGEVPRELRNSVGPQAIALDTGGDAFATETGPWLTAKLIDGQGRPLQGVQLTVGEFVKGVSSDSKGILRAGLGEAPDEIETWGITFERLGFATHYRRELRVVGQDLDLGEIVMEPGGSVQGRVVDESGRSVSGARIDYMSGVELPRTLEAKRFQNRISSVPSTVTDAQGQFELSGLPPGLVRLWAETQKKHLPEYSEAIEIRAGMTERGIVMTLRPLPDEHSIKIRVFDPQGEPAKNARVEYSHYSAEQGVTSQGAVSTDEEGRVEFVVFSDAVLTGHIVDADEEYSPAILGGLTTGPGEVRVDLTEKNHAHFVVRDGNGNKLEEFAYELRAAEGGALLLREEKTLNPAKPPTYVVPSAAYEIWVYAPLFKIGKEGPIDPKSPGTVTVRLEKVPGLRGLIETSKGPLAGASVSLHEAVPANELFERNGFRCRYDPSAIDSVRTDKDGLFVLTVREAGEFVVRADAQGFAAADTLAFVIMDDLKFGELELLLERGGSIEGRVLSQESNTETVVGISRGDGHDRTIRVSEAGSFRFDNLSPGQWRVRLRETEIDPHSTTISRSSGGRIEPFESLDWDCEVLPGETTYFDVDPIGRAVQVFTGQLILEEGSPSVWSAQLLPEGAFFAESNQSDWVPLDGQGRFEIACDEVGPRVLVLRSAGAGANELYLTAAVDTNTGASWSHELRSGSLVFTGAPPSAAQGIPQLVMKVARSNGIEFWATVIGDEGGRCEVKVAPTGQGTLIRPDFTTFPEFHPAAWPNIAEFTVTRGAETLVEVPN